MTRSGRIRSLGPIAALGIAVAARSAPAQIPDSAAAVRGIRELEAACRHDGGKLWGKSLCGPLIEADAETGFGVATRRPPEGTFAPVGRSWVGRVPRGMVLSNTATEWAGARWSTVRLPLPDDRFDRIRLLIHEAFHRIQPELGLAADDKINGHLDTRDGRVLLRLELHALGAALLDSGAAGRAAIEDAVIFRARRYQLFPGADTLERSLEIQEGLAEYTGTVAALAATGAGPDRVIAGMKAFEERPTFIRALGYGTGPALGLLLDRVRRGWRSQVAARGLFDQLRLGTGFVMPTDLAAEVRARAARNDGDRLAAEEDTRAEARAKAVADYRGRLVDGPVIALTAASNLKRTFNPSILVALEPFGTVYPTGIFTAEWGTLTVEAGGALLDPARLTVTVPVPPLLDPSAAAAAGPGWTLQLEAGWHLRAGPRAGDFVVSRVP